MSPRALVFIGSDASTQRVGARIRAEIPFTQDFTTFALGGGISALTPNFTTHPDNLWVFPLDLVASYRIGLLHGRAQVIPRAGLVGYLMLSGSSTGVGLKALFGGSFRYALGDLGTSRGITAGLEVLVPLVGGGWAVVFPVGYTF